MLMRISFFLFLVLSLEGCISKPNPAPIVERPLSRSSGVSGSNVKGYEKREAYIVQKGDTLYGIALKNGLDIGQLAEINNIADPRELRVGQELYLQKFTSQEQGHRQTDYASQPTLFSISQPSNTGVVGSQVGTLPDGENIKSELLKTEPKGVLLPYSSAAQKQLENQTRIPQNQKLVEKKQEPYQADSNKDITDSGSGQSASIQTNTNSSGINWGWPASGQVISRFSEKSKGVGISGQPKQAILASAPGTVVYSGNGLRGYGNLIIIKHNDSYLSAYGHNSKLFVHEGDSVSKGQKIAEMGQTDSGVVKLHFEIREKGKPVDPLGFLPTR